MRPILSLLGHRKGVVISGVCIRSFLARSNELNEIGLITNADLLRTSKGEGVRIPRI